MESEGHATESEGHDDQRLKVQQYVEDIHKEQNLQRVADLLAPDFVEHAGGSQQRNAEQLIGKLASLYKNVSSPRTVVEEIITQGDTVVYRWSLSGMYDGPNRLGRVKGQTESHSGATVLHIVDGKVREMWNYVLVPPAKGSRLSIDIRFTRD